MVSFAEDPAHQQHDDPPLLESPAQATPETLRKKKLKNQVKRLKAQVKRSKEARRKDHKLVTVESALAVLGTILPGSTMIFIRAQVSSSTEEEERLSMDTSRKKAGHINIFPQ